MLTILPLAFNSIFHLASLYSPSQHFKRTESMPWNILSCCRHRCSSSRDGGPVRKVNSTTYDADAQSIPIPAASSARTRNISLPAPSVSRQSTSPGKDASFEDPEGHNRSKLAPPRAASSHYTSREESLASSRQTSMQRMQSMPERLRQLQELQQIEGEIEKIKGDRLKRRLWMDDEESLRSSTQTWREREIENAENRIEGLDRRATGKRRKSRFAEDVDICERTFSRRQRGVIPDRLTEIDTINGNDPCDGPFGMDGSVDNDDPLFYTSVWGDTLQNHANELTVPEPATLIRRLSEYIGRDDLKRRASSIGRSLNGRPSLQLEAPSASAVVSPQISPRVAFSSHEHLPVQNTETLDQESSVLPKRRPRIIIAGQKPSWTRYPSETRHERALSAGASVGVTVKDFAPVDGKRKRQKITFRAYVRKVKYAMIRWYKITCGNFGNVRGGHRSSVSEAGMLEDPDLEMIPGGEHAFGQGFGPERLFKRGDREGARGLWRIDDH